MISIKIVTTQELVVKLPLAISDSAKSSNFTSHFQLRKIAHDILAIALNLYININTPSFLSFVNAFSINLKCSYNYCVYESTHSTATTTQTLQHLACCTLLEFCKFTSQQYSITEILGKVSVKVYVQAHQYLCASVQSQYTRALRTKSRNEQCRNLINGKKLDHKVNSDNKSPTATHIDNTNQPQGRPLPKA